MDNDLLKWAVVERQHIKEDLGWLNAGSVLKSPSGENITAQQIDRLKARLEHADKVIAGAS